MDKKSLNKLLSGLNLLYYEYDKSTNKIIVDKNSPKEDVYQEFITLTYLLTKNNIEFLVDENKDIDLFIADSFNSRLKQRCKNIFFGIKGHNKKIYILTDKRVKYAKNLPMIRIEPMLGSIELNGYEALVFTSKNAIRILNNITSDWKKIPSYVIAPQTAKIVKEYGGSLKFVGREKHGNEFAGELIPLLKNKKVLYIGGEKIVSDLVNILLENNIECEYKAIYKTICREYPKKIELPKKSIIIFSSPSTIECFLKNAKWDDSYTAISIGKTTAKYFPSYITPVISENTSLEGCVQTALNL